MATRDTQVAVEVLDKSDTLNVRNSQVAVEVLDKSTTLNVRVSQVAIEVLYPRAVTYTPSTTVILVGLD